MLGTAFASDTHSHFVADAVKNHNPNARAPFKTTFNKYLQQTLPLEQLGKPIPVKHLAVAVDHEPQAFARHPERQVPIAPSYWFNTKKVPVAAA